MALPSPFPPIVYLDGALASELEARGLSLHTALWSAQVLHEQPGLIQQVHLDYFRAGADVATTASYQASVQGFLKLGLSQTEAQALIARSVSLAQAARAEFWEENRDETRFHPLVAASVGPYGAYLADGSEYRGRYGLSQAQLMAFHRPRLECLMAASPDLLAFETLPCLNEAEALLRLLEEYPEQRAWFSFSAQSPSCISDGSPISEAGQLLGRHPQVAAIGLNCCPPKYVLPLLQALADSCPKPLIAYPNSGEAWDAKARCWLPAEQAPQGFGDLPTAWAKAGAQFIGGCCRTGPVDVAVLREALRDEQGLSS